MRKWPAMVLSLAFATSCFLNSGLTYANDEDIERRIENLKTAINKEIALIKFFKKKYTFIIKEKQRIKDLIIQEKQRIEQLRKNNQENLIRSRKEEIEKSLDEFEKSIR